MLGHSRVLSYSRVNLEFRAISGPAHTHPEMRFVLLWLPSCSIRSLGLARNERLNIEHANFYLYPKRVLLCQVEFV